MEIFLNILAGIMAFGAGPVVGVRITHDALQEGRILPKTTPFKTFQMCDDNSHFFVNNDPYCRCAKKDRANTDNLLFTTDSPTTSK